MTLPVMEPDIDADVLKRWARAVDEGPFSSLCWGERIAFGNPDSLTLLGALSAWTDRVPLVTTVVVPQLHDPVMLAKALATGDMLCGGRLVVGIGVGGRHEDYRAVGADPATQTMREMADRVAVMQRIWSGEKITESVLPVGPRPAQHGGPRLLVGTIGPKTIRSAAPWAEGLAGITLDLDLDKQNDLFDVARTAWKQEGKADPAPGDVVLVRPRRRGCAARTQVHRHLRHYMNWIPGDIVDAMAPTTGWAGTDEELVATLRGFAEIGTSEVHLIPTSTDIDQLRRVADLVAEVA